MWVQNNNKAFAYRIYSHFTQQCTVFWALYNIRSVAESKRRSKILFTDRRCQWPILPRNSQKVNIALFKYICFNLNRKTHKSRPCGFGQFLGQPIVRSFFHFFWSTKKKLSSLKEFLVSLWEFLVHQKEIWSTKKNFGTPKRNLVNQKFPETDQKFPETGQFFFGRPKKMRKRPDNWSTKRLTKTTWTGLMN